MKGLILIIIATFIYGQNVYAIQPKFSISGGAQRTGDTYEPVVGFRLAALFGKRGDTLFGVGLLKNIVMADGVNGAECLSLQVVKGNSSFGFFYGLKTYDLKLSDPYEAYGIFYNYDYPINKRLSYSLDMLYEIPIDVPNDSPHLMPTLGINIWW